MRNRHIPRFVAFLFVAHAARVHGSVSQSKAHIVLDLTLNIPNSTGAYALSAATRTAVQTEVAAHANTACAGACAVAIVAADVVIDTWDSTTAPQHGVLLHIRVKDISEALSILPDAATFAAVHDIRYLLSTTHSGNTLVDSTTTEVTSAASEVTDDSRPVQCGDGVLGGTEQCDDANIVTGDGCDATCQFEAGYMCTHHWRNVDSIQGPGQYLTLLANGSFVLSAEIEECSGYDAMCVTGALWRPENWVSKYAAGTSLPPRGFYCGSYCKTFPTPHGYRFDDNCELMDVDECQTGTSVCDYNAYCTNGLTANTPNAQGYYCQCDETFFATTVGGLGCAAAGVEIVVVVAGKKLYDGAETPLPDVAVLEAVRTALFTAILAEGYATAATSEAVLAEAVLEFPVAFISVSSNPEFSGRALWEMRVRIASLHTNYAAISTAAMFRNFSHMNAILSDVASADDDAYKMHTIARCANDFTRTCVLDSDCLSGSTCRFDVPDIHWESVEGSHASSTIKVASSGFSLLSTEYDITQNAWIARVRYDNTVVNVMDVLYLPHIAPPVSAKERATFRSDEFPCLPVGTGEFQQRRDDSLCCLFTVDDDYTTVVDFGTYINDGSALLGAAIAEQGSCATYNTPPTESTEALLDTTQDFVTGSFARTTRSYSTLDSVVSNSYQDLILFLAEEDMRNMGGIETTIDGGYTLRFFVGMAHVKALDSTRLHASFSHVEITADVSQAYVFTSSAATEFTFIRDVNVDLVQVKDQGGGPALKFARVQLTVPLDVTADEATGIIPVSSARVSAGYTPSSSPLPVYPCVETYHAARRGDIDTLLADQSWCALADDICSAIGPQSVSTGGQVYFIFPLENDIWSEADLDLANNFPKNLYLDFMVNVRTADGARSMTRVQTSTEIDALSISRQCEEVQISSSLSDILEVDMFLGLTPDLASFDASLVQGLDITRNLAASHMTREISSHAANVLTMIVKGTSTVFTPPYAAEYALEIEDMFTMHFLSSAKKAIIDQLIAADAAFSMQPVPGGPKGRMRLVPSAAVLQICPIHATRGEFGCVTRREIQERMHDSTTFPIVEISPTEYDSDDSSYMRSSEWLQTQLGRSEYVKNLGFAHSKTMAEKYNLNSRYRRGYMVSPTIPWRQAEMQHEGIATSIDLAQQSISVVLVALDQNLGGVYEPIVQVTIPGIVLPLSSSEFSSSVQSDFEAAVAAAAGTSAESVGVSGAAGGGGGMGRRLFSAESDNDTWVRFDVTVGFPVTDTTSAKELADNFAERMRTEEVTVLHNIVQRYHTRIFAHTQGVPARMRALKTIPPLDAMDAARVLTTTVETCRNDALFELDLSGLLPASARRANSAPTATCASRRLRHYAGNPVLAYDTFTTDVNVRGPQSDADWGLYASINDKHSNGERTYSFAQDPAQQHIHWLWWDLCGDVPSTGNVDAAAWREASDKFAAACCLCRHGYPVHSGNRKRYTHEYSWPLVLDASTDLTRLDIESKWALNPQLRSFRHSPPVSAFSTKHVPPPGWTVAADGSTQYTQCGVGEYMRGALECTPCACGMFQPEPSALACRACPLFTTSTPGSGSPDDCVCVAGYTSNGNDCVPCAAGQFKNTHGNGPCSACATGMVSRAAAPDANNCKPISSAGPGTDMHLFDAMLGVLTYNTDAVSSNRRCAVVDQGLGLSCPEAHYPHIYAKSLAQTGVTCFGSVTAPTIGGSANKCAVQYTVAAEMDHTYTSTPQNTDTDAIVKPYTYTQMTDHSPVVSEIALFLRRGYMGPSPLGWEQSLGARAAWTTGTTMRFAPVLRIDGTDLHKTINIRNGRGAVRLIAMVTRRELDRSANSPSWEWVVCGQKNTQTGAAFSYRACENEEDPDNPYAVNIRNPMVIDTQVFELNGVDCCTESKVPGAVFTRTLEWTPQVTGQHAVGEELWLYVFFMVGDSHACESHDCDESAVYSDMPTHMRLYELTNSAVRLVLLPGTTMTYALPHNSGGSGLRRTHTVAAPGKHATTKQRRTRRPVAAFAKGAAAVAAEAAGGGRKLLVAGADKPNANMTTVERTITSVDNNAQVVTALCEHKDHECSMLDVEMAISQEDYCLSEDKLMLKYKPILTAAVNEMAITTVLFFEVVSIVRTYFAEACVGETPPQRRLLQMAFNGESNAVFQSVSNNEMHLLLSKEEQLKHHIKAITIKTLKTQGTHSVPEVCNDEACVNDILNIKDLKHAPMVAATTPTDSLTEFIEGSLSISASALPLPEDDNDTTTVIVIVVVVVLVVVILVVIAFVMNRSDTVRQTPNIIPVQVPQPAYQQLHNTPQFQTPPPQQQFQPPQFQQFQPHHYQPQFQQSQTPIYQQQF